MLTDYFAIGLPDIRYTRTQLGPAEIFRVLDDYLDKDGHSVVLTSTRLRVKNVAMKQGYIDRAEFAPFTAQNLPIVILSVDKRPITWRDEQTIEVRALMTFGVVQQKEHHFELEVKLFDNLGRQLGRYVDDDSTIVRWNFKGRFTPHKVVVPKAT